MAISTFFSTALVAVCLFVLPTSTKAQTSEKLLSAEDVAAAREHSYYRSALSPDGEWLAYTVRDKKRFSFENRETIGTPNHALTADIWVTNTRTGECRSLTETVGNNWSPLWSPDGKTLAFLSDRDGRIGLWKWQPGAAQIARLSAEDVFVLNSWDVPVWLPDSSGLIVRVKQSASASTAPLKESATKSDDAANVVVWDSPAPASAGANAKAGDGNRSGFAKIELASGKLHRLVENVVGFGALRVSPDGKSLAIASPRERIVGKFLSRWELFTASLVNGEKRVLADDIQQESFGGWFSWSPDSRRIAYTDIGSQVFKNHDQTRGELYVISLSDGKRWSTRETSHPSFGDDYNSPLWDTAGSAIYMVSDDAIWGVQTGDRAVSEVVRIPGRSIRQILPTADRQGYWSANEGRSMLVLTLNRENMDEGVWSIDLKERSPRLLKETSESFGYYPLDTISFSSDGSVITYMSQAADRPREFWVTDKTFRSGKQLTHVNPQFEGRALGRSLLVRWRSPIGETLRGALLLPTAYVEGKRYPVIVNVYGGIFPSKYLNHFGIDVDMLPEGIGQFLATRGYAVFRPDTPLRVGTPMTDLAECVLSGLDELVKLGIADPDRLGIMGHSYGGYGTLAMIVQTDRFKAAVVNQGMGDLINFCNQVYSGVSNSGTCEDGQIRMGVTMWQDRERYINNSPVFFLDKVKTPLLFANGAKDGWSPPLAAEEIFSGLSRMGKTVQYVKYLDEAHNFLLYRDNVDFLKRVEAWFERYLQNGTK